MDIFQQQVSISFNVLFFFGIVLILFLTILTVVYKLRNKHNMKHQTATSGFLGRSLYSMLSLAVISVGIIFGIMALNSTNVINIEAKRDITGEIYTNVLLKDGDYSYVDFKITPSVEGDVWGQSGDSFDIYWSLEGANGESYSYIENDRTEEERSGQQKYFPQGSFDITVTVVFEEKSYTFTKQADF
jgi:hypothetical protein